MDRNEIIMQYRAAHDEAIENYDFDRARKILEATRRLYIKEANENYFRQMDIIAKQLNNVQGQKLNEYSDYIVKHESIRRKYLYRFNKILEKHDRQIRELIEERRLALEREKSRPVPEANDLFSRSKLIGKVDHQYENAKILFKEACQVQKLITSRRLRACKQIYLEQQRQIEEKQNQELRVFLDRIINDFQQLEKGHYLNRVVLNNRERIKEFKGGCWPPENYSVGPFHDRTDVCLRYYRDRYDFYYYPYEEHSDFFDDIPRMRERRVFLSTSPSLAGSFSNVNTRSASSMSSTASSTISTSQKKQKKKPVKKKRTRRAASVNARRRNQY